MTVPIDFRELLQRAAKRFSSQQAFAEALGISTSRLNRALNKGDYPLNALNCLKLASLTGEPASNILRAAGKSDVADLIEQLYGLGREALTPPEREILKQWRQMSPSARSSWLTLLRGEPPARSEKKARRKSA